MALDRSILLAFTPSAEPRVRLRSLDFPGAVEFSYDDIPPMQDGSWGNYARGAALALQQDHTLSVGLDGVIRGGLPTGGISSSAALGVACLLALQKVHDIASTAGEVIARDAYIENVYLGLRNGVLDQSMIMLGRPGYLTHLDCRTQEHQHIAFAGSGPTDGQRAGPSDDDTPRFTIALFYSGVSASLVDTDYNKHVAECQRAARALLGEADLPVPENPVLRDVPDDVFEIHGQQLPENLQRRARHYFTEVTRVRDGVRAWETGDLALFGRLISESGESSIRNYGCGCPELISLYEILRDTEGVHGARFSGAGFRGCSVAFIEPERQDAIREQVTGRYLARYPEREAGYGVFYCQPGKGAEVL